MADKYVLNYFPLTGRAEIARLMFHLAGVEFTDNQISFAEWPLQKGDEKRFPLAQMPTLEVDGVTVCQSTAIDRFLANEFGFSGSTNMEKAVIDQVLEALRDLFQDFAKIKFDKSKSDEEKKTSIHEYFAADGSRRIFGFLVEKVKSANGGFFLGDKISIADCAFVNCYEYMMAGCPTALDDYPALLALQKKFVEVEPIKKYLSCRKHTGSF